MAVHLGAGWRLVHLTDRVVELRKDDHAYRRLTGRDGYVRARAEPGMDRKALIERAIETAKASDAALALRVGKALLPSAVSLARYTGKQVRLAKAFGVPGEEPAEGVRRP